MSKVVSIKRKTSQDILSMKGKEPIVALTSYHTHTASLVDAVADIILVGDSVGMVMHGLESTIAVTMDMMCLHGQSVMRGSQNALVVVDMPFGSYEQSPQQAFANACQILKVTGAGAIKLEGGIHMAPTIEFLVQRGVPVMAHVGMTPQSILALGSFRARGRTDDERTRIQEDAKSVEQAGAFAVVLEAISEDLATQISIQLSIPTIGIGASAQCDGQILVLEDMLGLSERTPKFVKKYLDLHGLISQAVREYASDVRARKFPSEENTYKLKNNS